MWPFNRFRIFKFSICLLPRRANMDHTVLKFLEERSMYCYWFVYVCVIDSYCFLIDVGLVFLHIILLYMEIESGWLRISPGYVYKLLFVFWESHFLLLFLLWQANTCLEFLDMFNFKIAFMHLFGQTNSYLVAGTAVESSQEKPDKVWPSQTVATQWYFICQHPSLLKT